jgi:hypothetical protein
LDAELPDYEREVLSTVHTALAPHGEDAAEVDVVWSAGFGGWVIEITPNRVGAANVSIGCDWNDELLLQFGHTRLELWNDKRGPTPIEQLRQFLPAIFAGDFEEAGSGSDRSARVNLPDGKTASVGRMHLSFSGARQQRHRYASYSSPSSSDRHP